MRVVGLVAAGLLLVGCVGGTTAGEEQPQESPSATSTPDVPEGAPTPETESAPSSEPSSEPSNATAPCEDVMFEQAQGTIRAQQGALANSDFDAARAYASRQFRSTVTVEQFQEIIEGSYAFLLEDPALSFAACQRHGDSALLRVEVAGSPATIMVYVVVLESDSWFIDAASIAETRNDVTT